MKPIRSFRAICQDYGLSLLQTYKLQSLIEQRRGYLHAYWIQLALYVPYDFASRLHDELVQNERAVPDQIEANGTTYEPELTDSEIEAIARIDMAYKY